MANKRDEIRSRLKERLTSTSYPDVFEMRILPIRIFPNINILTLGDLSTESASSAQNIREENVTIVCQVSGHEGHENLSPGEIPVVEKLSDLISHIEFELNHKFETLDKSIYKLIYESTMIEMSSDADDVFGTAAIKYRAKYIEELN
jgi:hypothetical protein